MTTTYDLLFLLRWSVPVPEERRAVLESWQNLLRNAGFSQAQIDKELAAAQKIWDSRQPPFLYE